MAEETERPMVDQMELVMAAQQAVPTVGTAEATAEATAAIQAVGTAKEPRARCSSETTRTQVCRNHTLTNAQLKALPTASAANAAETTVARTIALIPARRTLVRDRRRRRRR